MLLITGGVARHRGGPGRQGGCPIGKKPLFMVKLKKHLQLEPRQALFSTPDFFFVRISAAASADFADMGAKRGSSFFLHRLELVFLSLSPIPRQRRFSQPNLHLKGETSPNNALRWQGESWFMFDRESALARAQTILFQNEEEDHLNLARTLRLGNILPSELL